MKVYYELEDDMSCEGRWYLNKLCDGNGMQIDSRELCYGKLIDLGPPLRLKSWKDGVVLEAQTPLRVCLDPKRPGVPLDFTFTNADMPVVTMDVAELLFSIAPHDIQRIPITVESQVKSFEIINIVRVVDCIDKERSDISWYKEGNDIRPDKAGEPEVVRKLVVNPFRIGGCDIFRLKGWKISIIISQVIKEAFEDNNVRGVKYQRVSL